MSFSAVDHETFNLILLVTKLKCELYLFLNTKPMKLTPLHIFQSQCDHPYSEEKTFSRGWSVGD